MRLLGENAFRDAQRRFEELRTQSAAVRQRARALQCLARETRAAVAETIEATSQTVKAVRAARARRPSVSDPVPSSQPLDCVAEALATIGIGEDELDDFVCDLIAAYRTDAAKGNEAGATLTAGALRAIGRHLARQLGPRRAGLLLQ